jgi:hypothetical protein
MGTRESVVSALAAMLTLVGFAGVTALAMGESGEGAASRVSVHSLPVGDGKVTTTGAQRGYVYRCGAGGNGGGASSQGPWFNGDGTFDLTEKATVDGAVSWSQATYSDAVSGSTRTITSKDLPVGGTTGNFPISSSDDAYQYDHNPNSIKAQSFSYTLPANPQKTGFNCIGGMVGIARNGVVIFDGLDAGNRDAVAWEVQDACGGHPQSSGVYHYHSLPSCLTQSKANKSKLVGYAFDGFPIFNGRDLDGNRYTNAELDACHGTTSTVKLDGEKVRTYHYEATREFPYTVSCFRGTSVSTGPAG